MRRDRFFSICIFIATLGIYLISPVIPVSDTAWTIPQVVSILEEGNDDLNEYAHTLKDGVPYHIVQAKDSLLGYFPAGIVYIAAVFGVPLKLIYGSEYLLTNGYYFELFVAAFMMSFAALLFFQVCRQRLGPQKALYLALFFALGTSVYSTASRALWQQTGAIFLIILFLRLVLSDGFRNSYVRLACAGLILGIAYVTRPLLALWIITSMVYLAFELRNWKRILPVVLAGLCVALAFAGLNIYRYDSILPPYYRPERVFEWSGFPEALAANIFSPARGLLVWHPLFLLAFIGIVHAFRNQKAHRLEVSLFAAIIAQLILISTFPHWWGGHSIGPRLMLETVPMFCFLLVHPMQRVSRLKNPVITMVFTLLGLLGVLMHTRASMQEGVLLWNVEPTNVDQHPQRVWDTNNPQFLHQERVLRILFRW